jgi:hypothetical protein
MWIGRTGWSDGADGADVLRDGDVRVMAAVRGVSPVAWWACAVGVVATERLQWRSGALLLVLSCSSRAVTALCMVMQRLAAAVVVSCWRGAWWCCPRVVLVLLLLFVFVSASCSVLARASACW